MTRQHTAATRAKMSEAAKASWADPEAKLRRGAAIKAGKARIRRLAKAVAKKAEAERIKLEKRAERRAKYWAGVEKSKRAAAERALAAWGKRLNPERDAAQARLTAQWDKLYAEKKVAN